MEKPVFITATELKKTLGRFLDMVGSGIPVVVSKNGGKTVKITSCRMNSHACADTPVETGKCVLDSTDVKMPLCIYRKMDQESAGVSETAGKYQQEHAAMTYEAFMDMYEETEERMEFINGEVYPLASPTVFHQDIVRNLLVAFAGSLKGKPCRAFVSPFDVHFRKKGNDSPDVCQPDVLIVCDMEGNINDKGKYMGTPALVVEILSPGSRSKDMATKLNTYMLSGVKEFWVADPVSRIVLAYMFKDCEIDGFLSCKEGESIVSRAFPGLEVSVADVFEV